MKCDQNRIGLKWNQTKIESDQSGTRIKENAYYVQKGMTLTQNETQMQLIRSF